MDRGSSASDRLSVTGTVHDMNGDPVGDARLSWELREGTPRPMADIGVRTAEDGSYRIPLLHPGTWEIRAIMGDLDTEAETVLLEDEAGAVDLRFSEPLPAE